MKRVWSLVLMLAVSMPAWAGEGAEKASPSSKKEPAKKKKAEKPSPIQRLAEVRIDEFVVPARMINIPLPGKTRTLQQVLDKLDALSRNERVGAVLLDVGNLALSLADVQELRAGIRKLRKHDKRVTAFLNGGSPNGYLLACAADEIAMAPTGSLMIPGIGAFFPFMKGYYQMLGLEFDVITAGRYKYPGFVNRRKPNEAFLEEYNAILDGLISEYMRMIGTGRKLSPGAVQDAINTALFNANQALHRGLVDTLAYYDECRDRILKRNKLKRLRDRGRSLAHVNSIQDIMELINDEMRRQEKMRTAVGPKIAVLHARGPIIDISVGAGLASQVISRDDFVKVAKELRKNKSIKAVVLRIDSPGGSGYASDVIWQELRRLNDTKPLVVSMGSVAASGGYYIACPARRIFAQPTTITGSIGVLAIFQSAQSMLNRRDYEFVEMKRGRRATLGAFQKELAKEDRRFIQQYIEDFYNVFIDRVAQTRRIPDAEVRKIAEGRVYTGRQALKIGLVDELGGLAEAIEAARSMANIPPSAELKIVHYPRAGSLGELLESFSVIQAPQLVQRFSQALSAAPAVSFDQQLAWFSHSVQPLCWMAVPVFFPSPWLATPPQNSPITFPRTTKKWLDLSAMPSWP